MSRINEYEQVSGVPVRIDRKTIIMTALLTGLITLLVYVPALQCGFINLDDPFYIQNNDAIRHFDWNFIAAVFSRPYLGGWIPLTHISFALDFCLWGLDPFGYHLTNIVIHAMNTAMVVFIADRLCRECLVEKESPSDEKYLYPFMLLLAGLLFGVHPLRVESVAWVSERKDVLNGLFVLGAILCYLRFVQLKDGSGRKMASTSAYLLSLLLFVVSLAAKQVSVTIPVIMLVMDWYPLRRLRKGAILPLLLEKAPFFAASLAVSIATIVIASQENQLISINDLPFYVRVVVSGNAVFEYCRLMLFPVGISPDYALPKPIPYGYVVKSLVVAFFCCVSIYSMRKNRLFSCTWFSFIIMLLPMLAFIHSGDDIAMAARYTYLPSIAVSISAAVLIARAIKTLAVSRCSFLNMVVSGMAASFLIFNIWITGGLIKVWKDTGTFWTRVIDVQPSGRAYGDRGVFYLLNGKSKEAAADFSVAIKIASASGMPAMYNLYAFRGVALSDVGRYEEAINDFDTAIGMFPHPTYYYHRALAMKAIGRLKEAEIDFARAGTHPRPIDWF